MISKEKLSVWFIGIGLVIVTVHNPYQPFIKWMFLPTVGTFMILLGSFMYLEQLKNKEIDFGEKKLWIPLAIIAGSIIIRPIYALITGQSQWGMKLEWSNAGYGLGLFSLYLASRKLEEDIFKFFKYGIIIASIGMIAYGLFQTGVKTGGFISPANYDMAAGFLIFGLVVSIGQEQWWLSGIAIVGLFFTGADEAIFIVGILFIVILIRRDWSKKLLIPIGSLTIIVLATLPLHIPQNLYSPSVLKVKQMILAIDMMDGQPKTSAVRLSDGKGGFIIASKELTKDEMINEATGYRWNTYWKISDIKPLGYGYNVNNFYVGIPHNIVLIIVEQIGVIAAIAWLWIAGYGIFRTRWKYAWISMIAMGVFDHYVWTQASFWFWALAGVSSSSSIESDKIYKGEK